MTSAHTRSRLLNTDINAIRTVADVLRVELDAGRQDLDIDGLHIAESMCPREFDIFIGLVRRGEFGLGEFTLIEIAKLFSQETPQRRATAA